MTNFYNLNGKVKFIKNKRKDYKKIKEKLSYLKHIYKIKTNKFLDNLNDNGLLEELKELRKEIDSIEKELFFLIEY